jgi:hypothetical protein
VRPISFSIPEEHLAPADLAKTALLATRVVDPDVRAALGQHDVGYAFEHEDDYFADLRSARFGVTTNKAAWDCLRHSELAASGCVPCFRDLLAKPALCAPHALDDSNCVPRTDARDLLQRLEAMSEHEYETRRTAALSWARQHTTRSAAERFLTEVGVWP